VTSWPEVTLGELCHIARGGSPRPIKSFLTDDGDGINWIKIGDATAGDGKYIASTQERIRPEGLKMSRLVKPGDFLLSNSMSFGRPYIMRTTGCIHDGWLVLRDKSHRFDPDYLYYFLGSDMAYRQFDSLAAGSTVRNLNTDLVKTVKVVLPPLEEQRRIVAVLDEAFAAIATATANAEKNLANARELFENSTSALLNGSEWPTCSLDEVCAITSKLVDPRSPNFIDLPHIGAGNMESRTGAISGVMTAREEKLISAKFLFDASTVLYSKIRPYLMKTCRPDFAGLCSADVYPLTTAAERLDRDFLFHVLMSREFTAYAEAGSARSGMPKVNRDHLFAYQIRLPAIEIQRQIAERIDAIADGCAQVSSLQAAKLASLANLKQSLLHRAFTGELTPAMPETIVA
jgi:type I restriction enzyme S subunit